MPEPTGQVVPENQLITMQLGGSGHALARAAAPQAASLTSMRDAKDEGLFLQACGARRPLRLEVTGFDGMVVTHVFHQPFVLVGNDPRADLILEHEEVSKRHVYLQIIAGRVFWLDLLSRTGVRVDARPQSQGWLNVRDPLSVGPFTIRLAPTHDPDESAEEVNPLDDWDPLGKLAVPVLFTLSKTDQADDTYEWAMERTLATIGRAETCTVQMVSSTVSRIHCALLRTSLGVYAIDLLSNQGIQVNGQPVRAARLNQADDVHVGRFSLRVNYAEAANGSLPPLSGKIVRRRAAKQLRGPKRHRGDNGSALASADVRALMEQFGRMQRDMFDQFQQTLLMVTQTMAKMHQDEMEMVREELRQIHALTRQMHAYQAELAKVGKGEPLRAPEKLDQNPSAPMSPQANAPRPLSADPLRSLPIAVPDEGRPVQAPVQPRPRSAPITHGEIASKRPAQPPAAKAEAPQSEDVHLWLTEQIKSIQKERQSRWDKIAGFLLRK